MMTPSRIKSAGGAASYYGKDDYYVTGEAGAPGIEWGGKGAAALGLKGLASVHDFQAVLEGNNPKPDGPAISAASKEHHHAGWDFTFTVPKSVSLAIVAAEKADPALAERLQSHVMAANSAMMTYLEQNHAFTRVRGEGGKIDHVQTKNLVYASVLHRTTRGGDPHFHVHNPTANTTQNPETGVWSALETRQIYKWQQIASLVGARELQARLMQEGFNLERQGELKWEIAGVDPALLKEFSSRSAEIDEKTADLKTARGVQKLTNKQRDMVQRQTRKAKEHQDRETLSDRWHGRAEAFGAGALASVLERASAPGKDVTPTLLGKMHPRLAAIAKAYRDLTGANSRSDAFAPPANKLDPDPQARGLVSFGVKVIEEQTAVGSRHQAMLHALRASPAGVTYDRLERALHRLTQDGHVVGADRSLQGGITTGRTLRAEQEILAAVERGKGASPPLLEEPGAVLSTSPTGARLNESQRSAVIGFFASTDRVRAIPGFAGVGKTFAFAAVREVAEQSGHRVLGLSSFNTHVQEFRAGAGIEAKTIAAWLRTVETALATPGPRLDAMKTESRNLHLIVDEASTVTNDSAYRLLKAVDALGIRSVTLAGDTRQTGGPGAGNAFKLVLDRGIEQFPLKTILRQQAAPDHLREGVRLLAEGKLKAGMTKLAPNIHALGKDASELDLARKAVDLWAEKRAAGLDTLLITATNKMRALQSTLARDVLKAEGVLARDQVTRERLSHRHMSKPEQLQATSYQLGDVLVFNTAFQGVGPARGDRATVIGIDTQNNLLKLKGSVGTPGKVDLNKEHARGYASFAAFALGTQEIAKGERLVWEARFKDRGYERGGEFTVLSMGKTHWEIQHADGRRERIRANDPALAFTSYAYAMTTERAQGKSVEAPVSTLPTTAGQAVAETKNYVNWSRLKLGGEMVTNDAPRLLQMLAQNDGQKAVALDHVSAAWAKAVGAVEVLGPMKEPNSQTLDTTKAMDGPGQGMDLAKPRTIKIEPQISRGRSL